VRSDQAAAIRVLMLPDTQLLWRMGKLRMIPSGSARGLYGSTARREIACARATRFPIVLFDSNNRARTRSAGTALDGCTLVIRGLGPTMNSAHWS